ncbi:MAG: OadG family protein [Prolixibacteraceae bacterium]|jgi:Na+-transporting methylmalonyl-CoA/oxaloacetate decarboxylase gamma subunit|nr:OadG family protein [Prolixibacteraceae bacterium]
MTILEVNTQTWTITLVGWSVVFFALVVLIFVFNNVPKLLKMNFKKDKSKTEQELQTIITDNKYISGDETAAIAMAIHMFFEEQHDEESNVITIKRIQKRYSPWSSKIYGMRNFPN